MRRDREQILRQAVVDLARYARPLLRDGAAELGRADRPPGAHEHQPESKEAKKISLCDVGRPMRRVEDEMQRREELQREAEGEPLCKVVAGPGESPSPPDDSQEIEKSLDREHRGKARRLGAAGGSRQRGQFGAVRAQENPGGQDSDGRGGERVPDRAVTGATAGADERRRRDQARAQDSSERSCPGLRGLERAPAQDRDDREGHQRERPDEEACCEEQIGAQPVDGEPTGGENRHEEPGKRHRGLQHEQERGRVVLRSQDGMRDKERQAGAE